MILRIACFTLAASIAYAALSASFGLVCISLGHNAMEMLYGGTAVYFLTLVAAVEGAWLLPDEIRRSSSFTRLTQRLRSVCDWRLR